jgi:hypothetical protein
MMIILSASSGIALTAVFATLKANEGVELIVRHFPRDMQIYFARIKAESLEVSQSAVGWNLSRMRN